MWEMEGESRIGGKTVVEERNVKCNFLKENDKIL